jgi:hypothetical protein
MVSTISLDLLSCMLTPLGVWDLCGGQEGRKFHNVHACQCSLPQLPQATRTCHGVQVLVA